MTRKDYVLIAEVLKNALDGQKPNSHCQVKDATTAIYNIANDMADRLRQASGYTLNGNKSFDKTKFLTACGVRD